MLFITVPGRELFNEETNEFIRTEEQTLQLEHSLVSLSKWESKWHKPFLTKEDKTYEETIDYIKCMTITQNVKSDVFNCLSQQNIDQIEKYIDNPMTATTFSDRNKGRGGNNGEQVTSELIYYWMIAYNIPAEFQKWHLNRLLTLVRICDIKNQPTKKMSGRDTARKYASLNAARKKKYGTRG